MTNQLKIKIKAEIGNILIGSDISNQSVKHYCLSQNNHQTELKRFLMNFEFYNPTHLTFGAGTVDM
jgi:hypothetical protein